MNYIKALWAYRGFILGGVKREFQSKYRDSLLELCCAKHATCTLTTTIVVQKATFSLFGCLQK
jgi:hypothetical protein